jgi:4-hydroxythreonine-4-phosphate dehydrogenase
MSALALKTGSALAVTMGDPAGIGPDITLTAWLGRHRHEVPGFVVFGDPAVYTARARRLGLDVPVQPFADSAAAESACDRVFAVIPGVACGDVQPGMPSPAHAAATIDAIDRATAAVLVGTLRAVVTNPIAKSVLYAAGFRHPGHTEYLAHLASQATGTPVTPVMMLASDVLRVVPATIHIPLADVPAALTSEGLTTVIEITHAALRQDFGIPHPRIAVAGLNPHAGENGTIGTQDRDLIAPVIAHFQGRGWAVTGPHSADTLFHAAARARYDVAIAMYHDQALIPIKTLSFDTGVNVTLGLPFVRTSPDHGTAFDIAGTGRARADSLIAALKLADAMVQAR